MKQHLEREDSAYKAHDKKNIRGIKGIIIFIASSVGLALLIAFLVLYKPMSSLEGDWVRQPDDNAMANGMVIEIKKQNGVYVGEVIEIDDERGMPIGTIKWQGFQKDGLSVFAYYDMTLAENANDRYYNVGYAVMSLDRNTITLYNPSASTGKHQVWIKRK